MSKKLFLSIIQQTMCKFRTNLLFYLLIVCSALIFLLLLSNISTILIRPEYIGRENATYMTIDLTTCHKYGLGNKMFMLASLYGIAKTLGRIPFLNEHGANCVLEDESIAEGIYPNLFHYFEKLNVPEEFMKSPNFSHAICCSYVNVSTLRQYSSNRFISLNTNYYQSYRYFHTFQEQIADMFSFSTVHQQAAEKRAQSFTELYGTTLRLTCVHIRRGDFVKSSQHQESTEHFVMSTVRFLKNITKRENQGSITVFIGNDPVWIHSLFDDMAIVMSPDRKEVDLAFMVKYCNTIVLTASASTFGYWGAYLSSASAVYYNYEFAKLNSTAIPYFTKGDFFLPHWQALKFK